MLYLTLGVSLSIGIGLFFLLPAGIGGLGERYLGWNPWIANLTEGVVRLILADRVYLGDWFHARCETPVWLPWCRT